MKIEKKHIKCIQEDFASMESRQDFLDLLNYAKPLIYGGDFIPFELKQITYYANPKNTNKAYKEFAIRKKSGGTRTIYAPSKGLKAIQKTIALILQCVYEPHKSAKGFVTGKSIVDNAKEHIGQNYVYNLDLKDFFPSIDQARVWACLKLKPFNLIDNELKNKVDESSSFTILQRELPNFMKNGDINDLIIKLDYQRAYFKEGSFVLKLPNEGKLTYIIETSVNDEQSGIITIFKRKSCLNYINEQTLKLVEKTNLAFEDIFPVLLGRIIRSHQEKLVLKDTKSRLASMIAGITCAEMQVERKNSKGNWVELKKNVLPQGAPTSPVLSNIICQKLDKRLTGVAKRFNLKYTRYADDITFSSMHNVYKQGGDFLVELERIIKDQGFDIKESKTRLQKTGYRQEVTGLVVNDLVNVRKRYVKQIRMWLYYWEKYGYNKAEAIFLKDYFIDKGHVKKEKPNFQNVLSGKLEYLKMVKGFENGAYLSLKKRFEKLKGYTNPIDVILTEWENNGIESAMNIYKLKENE